MRGIFAEASIGDHHQVRLGFAQRANRLLDHTAVVPGFAADSIFTVRQTKQNDPWHPQLKCLFSLSYGFIDRQPVLPWHCRNRLPLPLPWTDKKRIDQVVARQPGLTHQPAQPLFAAHPSTSILRKLHCSLFSFSSNRLMPKATPRQSAFWPLPEPQ